MELYRRGKTWWTQFFVNGERVRKSTGQTKKTAADEVAHKMLQMLQSGEPLKSKPVVVPTLTEFAERFSFPMSRITPTWNQGQRRGISTAGVYWPTSGLPGCVWTRSRPPTWT